MQLNRVANQLRSCVAKLLRNFLKVNYSCQNSLLRHYIIISMSTISLNGCVSFFKLCNMGTKKCSRHGRYISYATAELSWILNYLDRKQLRNLRIRATHPRCVVNHALKYLTKESDIITEDLSPINLLLSLHHFQSNN